MLFVHGSSTTPPSEKSLKQSLRKLKYDRKRTLCRKYHQWLCLHQEKEPFRQTTLINDPVTFSIPPHLSFLLSYGSKLVPYTPTARNLQLGRGTMVTEIDRLKTVLLWHSHFAKVCEPSFFSKLPHRAILRATGSKPPNDLIGALGVNDSRVISYMQDFKDSVPLNLSALEPDKLPFKGVGYSLDVLASFFKDHVVVGADKDGDHITMSLPCYLLEQKGHMNGVHSNGSKTYHKLSAPSPDALEVWLSHGHNWLTSIHFFVLASLRIELAKTFATFLHSFHCNRLPSFYLLVKSHVRFSIENNRWPSRPLVGLTKWATTRVSIILSIFGNIALRVDRLLDPTHAPLIDLLDFVSRLRDVASHDCAHEYVVTSVDFNWLYTTFVWKDVVHTWDFWMKFLLERATQGHITPYEVLFLRWLSEPVGHDTYIDPAARLPFLSLVQSKDCCIGHILLNFVWSHNIFHAPGEGVFTEHIGWPMGTNVAAPFSNLSLCFYERRRLFDAAGPSPIVALFRFSDDAFIVHRQRDKQRVLQLLGSTYRPHLSFKVEALATIEPVGFLGVMVLSLSPLMHCTKLKSTHSGNYIPFAADVPRHVTFGWV